MLEIRLTTRTVALGALTMVVLLAGLTAGMALAETGTGTEAALADPDDDHDPIEDGFAEPVPEPGDEYYEAAASDGSWISYINPRDEYRSPYLGDGSGKLCVTLLNEAGEPIVGESVPNTRVTIPTGDSLEWHTGADPMTVELPLTENYDRPLDSDQFGTTPDLPQGDGYLDSHCIEFHGPDENETIEYGEAEIDGEFADWIDVVGYIQQAHEAWDTDVDPLEDAQSYEEAGGGWTYEPGASHGQAVVVLQLDPPEDAYDDGQSGEDDSNGTDSDNESESSDNDPGDDSAGADDTGDENSDQESDTENSADETEGGDSSDDTDGSDDESDSADDETEDADDEMPGFVGLVAIIALSIAVLTKLRR